MDLINNGMTLEAALAHYGVPGMKWGIRNDHRSIGGPNYSHLAGKKLVGAVKNAHARRKARIESEAHPDHLRVQGLRKKRTHQLSNEELRQLTQRIKLETEYNKINPATSSKGKQAVGKAIAKGGGMFVNQVMQTAVNAAVKVAFDKVTPKKKDPDPNWLI